MTARRPKSQEALTSRRSRKELRRVLPWNMEGHRRTCKSHTGLMQGTQEDVRDHVGDMEGKGFT